MPARATAITAVALATAALVAAGPASSQDGPAARAAGGSVGIGEREFRISVYRRVVTPGVVRFNVRNFGEDVHDFAVFSTRGRGRLIKRTKEISSGDTRTLTVSLASGAYRLVCTTSDHLARGMKARITVRRAR